MAYDYIIVGGGTSGCVLASRLTENPAVRVLLIEAGPRDTNPYIHMPVGFFKMTDGSLTWGLATAPQKHAMNREIPYAQARVLGGGSSINAQVFTRGRPSDFDAWEADYGCEGWAFADIQPYFLKSESNDLLADQWHGTEGPLGVSTIKAQPLTQAFVRACQQVGMPYNPDFNGERQAGVSPYQTTTRNSRRCSAAVAYLKPALSRPNLVVETRSAVTRVVFEGSRAVGVELAKGSQRIVERADCEVILTAGAIGSPKLMLLSGIGPADELRSLDIEVRADRSQVGRNLQDHYGIDICYELSGPYSLDKYSAAHQALWAGVQYAMFKTGPITSTIVEGGAFWHSEGHVGPPDLQFHFLLGAGVEAGVPRIPSGSGATLNSYTLKPKARGSVTLRSNDFRAMPIVDPNFLGDPYDLQTSIEGLRISREIMHQSAFARYIKREHFPGDDVHTHDQLEDYARRYGRTSYHPVGACRMGGDQDSVVDPQMRVRSVEGLRICDSSIMPELISSNTNATAIMIGEKAADLIRGNKTVTETAAA